MTGDTADRPAVEEDPRGPLWRGAQYFRALSVLYAVGLHVAQADRFSRIGWSWVLLGAVVVVSAVCALAYVRGFGRNRVFVAGETVASAGLVWATWAVVVPGFAAHNQCLPTTLWMTNPVVSLSILSGPWAGVVGGIVMAAVNAVYRGTAFAGTLGDADYPVMMAVGLGLGVAARVAIRSAEAVREAERRTAEARVREQLARQVHDGVLQTLALVARRCAAMGSSAADLAALAGEQEAALRRLISESPTDGAGPAQRDEVDLRDLLRAAAGPGVTLSEPGRPVRLAAARAHEVVAAVRNALGNTALHAGPEARSLLLLEDLGDDVVVTVRDDGPGIAAGRLEAARAEGRLGVRESIVGRIRALGGRADLVTGPGDGVEWELTVPKCAREEGCDG
ncbi:MacS family sensor histidine kinase [Tsukamurella soli]|uniref:DUF5931 domain-containing protein n=1 Tax=Tsukamurella soli TaxID=644556 RepID=A0ABP8JY53_9ACTN